MQRALDLRMEAVARACHELRGPITAARLGLELGSRAGALSAAQLAAIDSELRRATLALDDLAHAPEARQAPREIEAVDLGALLRDSVRAWRPVAAEAGVELELACGESLPCVRGDSLRLGAGDRQPDRERNRARRYPGRGAGSPLRGRRQRRGRR